MAKRAFTHFSGEYARFRPSFPDEAVRALIERRPPAEGDVALDVGAGTGIFSNALAAAGWPTIAVDADAAMLSHVDSEAHAVRCVAAEAERLPFVDASCGLISCAQAFHWFNPPVALAEFARVLRADGGLALLWNNRDASRSAFLQRYDALIARYNPAYRVEYREQDWSAKIRASGAFSAAETLRFVWDWTLPQADFEGYAGTVSYIRNVLSREQRPRFFDELRELLADAFGDGMCVVSYRTNLWFARRTAIN